MNNISLIANSGIQFVEIGVSIFHDSDLLKKKKYFAELKDKTGQNIELVVPYYRKDTGEYIIREGINPEAIDPSGKITEELIHNDFSIPIDDSQRYRISYHDALNLYEEAWIPVPYLKTNKQGNGELTYAGGPWGWARMYIARASLSEQEGNITHKIILAFDTQVQEDDPEYVTLKNKDINEYQIENHAFTCPLEDSKLIDFTSNEWVFDWLSDIFDARVKAELFKSKGLFFSECAGAYIALLRLLSEARAFPEVHVYGKSNKCIDISLVLDIGNSRTCGLILETSDIGREPFSFQRAQKLAIRDLSQPNKTYEDPFEMRIAFVKERFGNIDDYLVAFEDELKLFSWPSLVRVGPEASRLIVLNDQKEDTRFYLSSPKRYLWDHIPSDSSWRSIYTNLTGEFRLDSTFFGIALNFTEEGDFIVSQGNGRSKNGRPAIDYSGKGSNVLKRNLRTKQKSDYTPISSVGSARYSRSSLMTFTIFELLLQALSQINGFAYRETQDFSKIPRKLKTLVLTCPTAMTQIDQRNLKNAADDAVDLLKIYFDESFIDRNLKIIPQAINTAQEAENPKNWMYDEATCSQLAYLYGEITYRFNNDIGQYFKYCGRYCPGLKFKEEKSVTIASIDIGGGTTDVMIGAYQLDPESNGAVIEPQPFFWEGFNLAGDDLMRRIIERLILPQIYRYAEKLGCQNTKALMSDLFGPHTGKLNVKDRRFKNVIVNQLIISIAYGFVDFAGEGSKSDSKKLDEFFYKRPRPNQSLLDEFNLKFRKNGAKEFDIEQLTWDLNINAINKVIYQTIGSMLSHICAIIAQYSCDIVILAGKPTKIPVIKEIIVKNLPVFPDKVITLGNYRIGSWYPFSNSHHEIKDPKTIVTVGAAISHMSELGKLGAFQFNTEPLKKIKSTANFIGKYNPNSAKISEENVFFKKNDDEAEVKFSGGHLLLGKRQLENPNWLASPIYQIKYKDKYAAENLREKNYSPPYKIIVKRSEISKEEIEYEALASDKEGNDMNFDDYFLLTPQSLPDEFGYWLDTGCFSLDIIDES